MLSLTERFHDLLTRLVEGKLFLFIVVQQFLLLVCLKHQLVVLSATLGIPLGARSLKPYLVNIPYSFSRLAERQSIVAHTLMVPQRGANLNP